MIESLTMIPGDFFLCYFGTIAITRLLLAPPQRPKIFIGGLHIRHYLFGIVLVLLGFFMKNTLVYAIGLGLIVDEIILVIAKGPGLSDEEWGGARITSPLGLSRPCLLSRSSFSYSVIF